MPEALFYPVPDSNDAKLIEEAYADEHNARVKVVERAWRYYNGEHDQPLKVQSDGYNDNVIINHVGALGDRITGFVIGDGIEFDSGDEEPEGGEGEEPVTDEIDALWQANRGEVLKEALVLSGAVEGHLAVRIDPRPGDYPQLTRIKQSHFTAFWNPFDASQVLWYRLEHVSGGQGKRIDYVRGKADQEGMIDYAKGGWLEIVYSGKNVGSMGVDKWEKVGETVWPYDWSPIVDWQNLPNINGYYGFGDLGGAIKLNDAMNFLLSNGQRIVKHHAAPKTIGTGFQVGDVTQSAIGGLWTVANENAKVYNLELQSDGAFMQWMAGQILSGLWQSGGMVDNQTIKDLVGQLTNFGLRVLYANAIKRTEKKRVLYAEAFEAINKHALELAGKAIPDKVETVWSDVLPEDDALVSQVLQRELELGIISKETYRTMRGYDNDREIDRLAGEQAAGGNVGASILGMLTSNRPFNRGQ